MLYLEIFQAMFPVFRERFFGLGEFFLHCLPPVRLHRVRLALKLSQLRVRPITGRERDSQSQALGSSMSKAKGAFLISA